MREKGRKRQTPTAPDGEPYLSLWAARTEVGLDYRTLKAAADDGSLDTRKFGVRNRYVLKSELQRFMRVGRVEKSHEGQGS